ncbi:MAG TPA: hypothetical protein PK176_11150 [Acidobacteriota bacterium]|nr:hypothetical protein [Acidobacteriota bacterium]HQM63860.1 hypothetical protein [Acidobacteriota bacterium]
MKRHVRFNLTVKLLEDLHTGTGMGDAGGIDSVQARDSQGRFIIRATHFKGILREQAETLCQMGVLPPTAPIDRLFGSEYSQRGDLQLTTLVAGDPGSADPTVVASTAREVNSRVPKEDTLRVCEFAPAGQEFRGEALLSDELADTFQAAVRATMFLGSSRTRGAGRVRITVGPKQTETSKPPPVLGSGRNVRILLENLEPLCLPPFEQAGQLIQTESFIRGQRLRAAFADWWTVRQDPGGSGDPPVLKADTRVSDALIVAADAGSARSLGLLADPATAMTALSRLQAIPLPLSIYSPKPTEQSGHVPWWATLDGGASTPQNGDVDISQEEMPDGYKRPKEDDVLVRFNSGWIRSRPILQAHLRNRVPDRRTGTDNAELFAEEEIAGNQFFVADLSFADERAAREFIQAHAPLFNETSWLRIGGGGRPARIVAHTLMDRPATAGPASGELRLVLTSDLIVRTANLNFATRLTPAVLARELNHPPEGIRLEEERTVCETQTVFGWNAITRRQRARALAIRRGSVFTFTGAGADELRKALLAQEALGERQEEGFGRFELDPVFVWAVAPASEEAAPRSQAERLAKRAEEICKQYTEDFKKLSATQWQWLRQLARHRQWEEIASQIEARAQRRSNEPWRKVLEALKKERPEDRQRLAGGIVRVMIAKKKESK